MAQVDWMGKGLNAGICLGMGAASGLLTKMDMDAKDAAGVAKPKEAFMEKRANWLALAGAIGGTAAEIFMPKYEQYERSVSSAGFTLLGRSMYFELAVKKADRVPGISRGRSNVYQPVMRLGPGMSGSPSPFPLPGPAVMADVGGVTEVPTGLRYE